MSLVSEALKKAEREAAAREAREKGLPQSLETPLQPYRARRGRRPGRGAGALWLVAAGLAAGVALAVVFARSSFEHEAGDDGSTKAASTPDPDIAKSAASTVSDPAPSFVSPEAPAARTGESTTLRPAPAPSPETAARERALPPRASEPAMSSADTQREFVRRIDLPDGSKLELGGIAYSETAPFAYLNGRLLKIGETAAGYTLVAIERDHVVVRGPMGELTIRSRPR